MILLNSELIISKHQSLNLNLLRQSQLDKFLDSII